MNREQFYRLFAKEYDTTLINSRKYCHEVFALLSKCLTEMDTTDRIYIKGLGTFKKRHLSARRVGNLNGEGAFVIPESEKIIFEPYSGDIED